MKISKLEKGIVKRSLLEMESELPVFFKKITVKENTRNPNQWEIPGIAEFPIYNSKSSSCKPINKPLSKLYYSDE